MIWENGILTCILSCKNRIGSLCLTQDTACLGLVHGDDPERCYGEGGGRGFMFGNACTSVVDSCQCMAKPIQYTNTYIWNLDGNDDPVCRTAKETQMYITDFWTQRKRERVR